MKMLRLPEVIEICGLKKSTIYARIKDGTFPKQTRLGARAVGWLEKDILGWIEGQVEATSQ